jgi:MYXO-CTERM domain-containing protein
MPFLAPKWLVAAGACLAVFPVAKAADVTWALSGGGSWGTASNWLGEQLPTADDIALFNLSSTGTITLDAARSVSGLSFTGLATILTGGGTNRTLTLGSSGINLAATAGDAVIGSTTAGQNVVITLGASQTWTIGSGRTLTTHNAINGTNTDLTLSGAGNFTRGNPNTNAINLGTGHLIVNLGGSNTVELGTSTNTMGGLTVKGGQVFVRSGAIGTTGNVILGDSVANTASAFVRFGNVTFTRDIVLQSGSAGTLRIDSLGASTVNLNGNLTGTNNLEITSSAAGIMNYGGSINFTGALTLSQLNTPTSASRVNITGAIGSNVTGVTISANNGLGLTTLSANNSGMAGTFDIGSGRVEQTANVAVFGSGALNLKTGASVLSASITNTGTLAFLNTAITLESGSTLDFRGTSGSTVTHTYSFANLTGPIQVQGATLIFRSTSATTKAFNGALNLSGDNILRIESTGFTHNLNLNRAITGSGTLTLRQAGGASNRNFNFANLATTGTANNFTGSLILDTVGGATTANLNQALGATTYDLRNNWILVNNVSGGLDSATSLIIGNASAIIRLTQPTVASSAALSFTAAGRLEVGNSASTLGSVSGTVGTIQANGALSALTLEQGSDTTFGGTFVASDLNALALTKSGSSKFTLTGASTFVGSVTVSAGTLELGTGGSFTADVTSVASGATLALAGGSLAGATQSVNLAGGTLDAGIGATFGAGKTLNLGGAGTVGAGNLAGSLTVDDATLRFDITSESTRDVLTLASGASLSLSSGTLALNFTGGVLTAGTYRLIDASQGTLTVNLLNPIPAGFAITGIPSGESRLSTAWEIDSNFLSLIVSGAPGNATWNAASSGGTWSVGSAGAANWSVTEVSSGDADKFYEGDNVAFGNTGAGTVTLADSTLAGTVSVDASSDYTLQGGSLQAVALAKAGSGKLTIANVTTLLGTATQAAGTTEIASGGSLTAALEVSGGTFVVASGGALSGAISLAGGTLATPDITTLGSGSITLAGGRLQLSTSGAFAFSRAITVGAAGGTFAFTAADAVVTDSTARALGGPLTLELSESSATATFSGILSGAGSLAKSGAGALTLTAANTFEGTTTVSAGRLIVQNNAALGSTAGGTSVLSGATLDLGGTLATNALNLGAEVVTVSGAGLGGLGALVHTGANAQQNALQQVVLSGDATFGGTQRWDIRGTGSQLDLAGFTLTKVGSNSIGLVSTTVTSGHIVINEGILSLDLTTTMTGAGSITVNSGGRLNVSFGTVGANLTRDLILNSGTLGTAGGTAGGYNGAVTINGASTAALTGIGLTLGGALSGSGSLTKTGSHTLVLEAASPDFGGDIFVQNNLIRVNTSGATGSGLITIGVDNTPGAATVGIELNNGVTIDNDLLVRWSYHASYLSPLYAVGTGTSLVRGNVTFDTVVSTNVRGGDLGTATNAGLRLDGELNVAGTRNSIVQRVGTVIYAGGASTAYTLNVTGTARLAANNGIGTSVTLQLGVSDVASFDLAGFDQTLAGIYRGGFSAPITNTGETLSTLTVNGSTDLTYIGSILIGTGDIALVKAGSHVWTLSGNNTFAGGTRIEDGLIVLGSNTALGTGTLTLAGGGLRPTATRTLANALVAVADTTSDLINAGTGDLTFTGALTGSGTLRTAPTATSRSVWLQGDGSGFTGTFLVDSAASGTNTRLGGTGQAANTATNAADWSSAQFVLSGTATDRGLSWNGQEGATVRLGSLSGDGGTIFLGASSRAANWEVGHLGLEDSFLGSILGAATRLTKVGTGTLELGGTNTFGGGIFINAGTLLLGSLTSLGSGAVTVNTGGTLDLNDLNPTNTLILSGGGLLRAGNWTGSVSLSGDISADTINGLTSATVSVGAGASVSLAGVTKDILLEGGTISDLSGFTGVLTYTSGTLADLTYTGPIRVGSNVTLAAAAFSGVPGALIEVVSGTATLGQGLAARVALKGGAIAGLADFAGELLLEDTAFSLTSALPQGETSATLTVGNGGTLSGTGSVGNLAIGAGGLFAPGNSPGLVSIAGTFTLEAGGGAEFEFQATNGLAGADFDQTETDILDLSGLSDTPSGRFLLTVSSLNVNGAPGIIGGWDDSASYSWEIFLFNTLNTGSYSGDITRLFTIDTSSFLGSDSTALAPELFRLVNTGNAIELQYAPIPEPSTYGLALGALALAGAALRRRRQKATS